MRSPTRALDRRVPARALGTALALTLLGACQPPNRAGDAGQAKQDEAGEAQAAEPAQPKRERTIPADGWNDDIAWRALDEGLAEAKKTGMPVMLVVHTAWCGNCKKLKQTFTGNDELEQLSEQFVMVHVDQDEHPEATLYGPDGQYIPRVMFLDADGNVDTNLQNPQRTKYRYFYTPQEDLVATMRRALTQHGDAS